MYNVVNTVSTALCELGGRIAEKLRSNTLPTKPSFFSIYRAAVAEPRRRVVNGSILSIVIPTSSKGEEKHTALWHFKVTVHQPLQT